MFFEQLILNFGSITQIVELKKLVNKFVRKLVKEKVLKT